jgi:hypothetical protein
LTPRLCSLIDGPEVERGAHFLILYYPARDGTGLFEKGPGLSERSVRLVALSSGYRMWPARGVSGGGRQWVMWQPIRVWHGATEDGP